MRPEVPVAFLPAHRRGVEGRQERGRRLGRHGGLDVVREDVPGRAVQVDHGVRNGCERRARLARRPAGPPADVGLGRRPERTEPAAEQLCLGGRGVQLDVPTRRERPAVLAVRPTAARTPPDDPSLGSEQRKDA